MTDTMKRRAAPSLRRARMLLARPRASRRTGRRLQRVVGAACLTDSAACTRRPSSYVVLSIVLTVEFWIVTLFGLLMPVLGYSLYRLAERKARQEGSLSNY